MTSTYRDMFAVCTIALLCLMSVSHSAPLDCKELLQPLDDLNPDNLEGTWAMVADSLNTIEADEPIKLSDSISVEYYNSTIVKTNRYGDRCHYSSHNVSIDGPHYSFSVAQIYNFTGTVYRSSCADCVVLSFKVEGPNHKSEEFCLFSKRRQVDEKEMREFTSQVECLKMPKHHVLDPTVDLCEISPRLQSST